MAEYYNTFKLSSFAGIVADCMGIELPAEYAPSVKWASEILKNRLGGNADRVILYHADAVGQYIWQKYTNLFAPVYRNTTMSLPFVSTVMSVTPVAHASMYTGLEPEQHGIQTYTRPKLECSTLYDVLLEKGLTPAIVAQRDSTFLHIFEGRDMDYFEEPNAVFIQKRVLELLPEDKYDVLSIHTFDYDDAAHHYGPESREGLNAIALEAMGFEAIANYVKQNWAGKHRTLLIYAPDHGQHQTEAGGMHGSLMSEDMNILHFYGTFI